MLTPYAGGQAVPRLGRDTPSFEFDIDGDRYVLGDEPATTRAGTPTAG